MGFGAMSRHWTVWKAAWQAESSRPLGKGMVGARAAEFLPSVLELQPVPPSSIGRALRWTIVAAFAAGALWATLGRIDLVATAQGTIISGGDSKIIRPDKAGMVAAIHVQEGQAVMRGEVLIELDAMRNVTDRARAVNAYRAAIVDAARLRALIHDQATFEAPTGADEAYVLAQQQLLRDQLAEYHADLSAAQQLVEQRRAAVDRTKAQLRHLTATAPMEAEGAEADTAREFAAHKKQLRHDRAALAEAEQQSRALVSEFQQTKQAELAAVETTIASLAQEVATVEHTGGLQRLVAPVDGVVRQLAVQTVGAEVTPAQPLLIVVPRDQPVEVEAQVLHKERRFVRKGQPVDIHIATAQVTHHATIPGRVVTVADEAVSIDHVGLVYPARISLDRGSIQVEGKPVDLSPGMAVTVEIQTGEWRIIEYLSGLLPTSIKERLRGRYV
jgi:hemolysin D